jgi:hypothetical protein
MEKIMTGLQWDIYLIYLDDIIMVGKTFENMIRNLTMVFDRLLEAGLKLKDKKCTLFAQKVLYFGHIISNKGIATDFEKVNPDKEWPEPSNVSEVRSFLGLCGYY